MENNAIPIVVTYPPGSGGTRLVRKFCGSWAWAQHPGQHSHYGWDTQGLVAWYNYPKYPLFADDLEPMDILEPMVTLHCLYSPTISKLFPERKIIRVQANFYLSLRRWWDVYGRDFYKSRYEDVLIWSPYWDGYVDHCLHAILTHATYYTSQHDQLCDELVKIIPGESEFSDFMLSEFTKHANEEFDQCWQLVLDQDPRLAIVMKSDLI